LSRRLKQTYHCQPLGELARQLMFSPPDKRVLQVRRIETLHDQLAADSNYPVDFLAYRITGYRREGKEAVILAGDAVLPDLRLMIDELSRSVRIPIDPEDDPVETIQALAERLDVSTKTISRWRQAGLRWRWVAPEQGGRKVLTVPRRASDRYVREHDDQVQRAAAFTQIEPNARKQLVRRARQIARRRDVSLNQVAGHLASKTGRGLETVRQVLLKHDRDHPDRAVFTGHTPPLNRKQKRVITRAYRVGVPVDTIAEKYGRARSTVYRVLHQYGAGLAGRIPLSCIEGPTFSRDDAQEVILGRPLDELTKKTTPSDVSTEGLPDAIKPVFDRPVIAPGTIRQLFVRYNFLKYQAVKTRDAFDRYSPSARRVEAFNDYVEQARAVRDLLVSNHLPVVLSVARRHVMTEASPGSKRLIELIEAGLPVLIQSTETFNPSRQSRFDSSLTNRLLARYATLPKPSRAQAQKRGREERSLERLIKIAGEAGVRIAE